MRVRIGEFVARVRLGAPFAVGDWLGGGGGGAMGVAAAPDRRGRGRRGAGGLHQVCAVRWSGGSEWWWGGGWGWLGGVASTRLMEVGAAPPRARRGGMLRRGVRGCLPVVSRVSGWQWRARLGTLDTRALGAGLCWGVARWSARSGEDSSRAGRAFAG